MVRGKRTKVKKQDVFTEICEQLNLPMEDRWKSRGSTICTDAFQAVLSQIAQTSGIPPSYFKENEKTVWQLIHKSQEAMVLALEIINKPSIIYRMECFLFLFANAWELLLKAKVISDSGDEKSIQNHDDDSGKRTISFSRAVTTVFTSDIDPIRLNLFRLENLRNDAAHHVIPIVPPNVMLLFQAGILNYEKMLTAWFERSLCERIPHGMMFLVCDIDSSQLSLDSPLLKKQISQDALQCLKDWQASVQEDIELLADADVGAYAIPIHFKFSTVNNPKKADVLAYWTAPEGTETVCVWRDRERPKYLPKVIADMMQSEGYELFTINKHTRLWKEMGAKNPGKGFGIQVLNTWYWYDSWVKEVRKHCEENKTDYKVTP